MSKNEFKAAGGADLEWKSEWPDDLMELQLTSKYKHWVIQKQKAQDSWGMDDLGKEEQDSFYAGLRENLAIDRKAAQRAQMVNTEKHGKSGDGADELYKVFRTVRERRERRGQHESHRWRDSISNELQSISFTWPATESHPPLIPSCRQQKRVITAIKQTWHTGCLVNLLILITHK